MAARQLCIKINFPAPEYNGHHANGQLVDIEVTAGVRENEMASKGLGGVAWKQICAARPPAGLNFKLSCAGLKSSPVGPGDCPSDNERFSTRSAEP